MSLPQQIFIFYLYIMINIVYSPLDFAAKGEVKMGGRSIFGMRQPTLLAIGVVGVLIIAAGVLVIVGAPQSIRSSSALPKIPRGAVAVVEGAPGGFATVTKAELYHSMQIYGGFRSVNELPKRDSPQYGYLEMRGLQTQLEKTWIEGTAAEEGFTATPSEVALVLRKLKSEGSFRERLASSHYDPKDLHEELRLMVLGRKVTGRIGRAYNTEWLHRTFCAKGFITEGCAQWNPADHPGRRVHLVEYG